jgi:hypothetical protein
MGTDPLGEMGPAIALGLAVQPSLLQLGLRLEATLPRSSPFAGSTSHIETLTFNADLTACVVPTSQQFQLLACANAGFVAMKAKGHGTANDSSAVIPLYQMGPSIGARWLASEDLFLGLEVVSRFFLTRPDLVIVGLPDRRQIETASVSAQLGGGLRW